MSLHRIRAAAELDRGKIIRREGGAVCYRVTGRLKVNRDYQQHYNFVWYSLELERVNHPTASRPVGSKTWVHECNGEYPRGWVEA